MEPENSGVNGVHPEKCCYTSKILAELTLVYRKKTGTIFSVIKLATSGSFIFPNEISHIEQKRLKKKDYAF